MGLNYDTGPYLLKSLTKYVRSYDGDYLQIPDGHFDSLEMLELGNQHVKPLFRDILGTDIVVAKTYFEKLGFKHTSFDENGKDGAEPIDLRRKIDKKYHNRFDVMTNFGTSEHVRPHKRQYECFRNVHICTKPGGLFIHSIPEVGLMGHCLNHYTTKFFEVLSELNGYEILEITRHKRHEKIAFISACIRKADDNREFTKNRAAILENIAWKWWTK